MQLLVVGLTGGIGSGKSTVAALLEGHGSQVVDVDALGREIVAAGGEAVDAVIERFGPEVADPHGGIDRAALAAKVFGDPEQLAALNEISHPTINRLIDARIDAAAATIAAAGDAAPVVVLDMAVLAESNLGRDNRHRYELVVTVEAPEETRLERLVERGLNRADAKARMASQATDDERRELADFVIGNGGNLDDLGPAVAELWAQLVRLAREQAGA